MDDIVSAIIDKLEALVLTPEFSSIMTLEGPIWYGDPLLVLVAQYPYIYVQADSEEPTLETTAYERLTNNINVGLVVQPSEYFDPALDNAPGDRPLVQAATLIRAELRRVVNRKSLLSGVTDTKVSGITYTPDLRGDVFVKQAIINVSVDIDVPKVQ